MASYVQDLMRLIAALPEVSAAYARQTGTELELYVVAPGGLEQEMEPFLATLGETAYLEVSAPLWRIVTAEGVGITVHVGAAAPAGLQPLFERTVGKAEAVPGSKVGTAPETDLSRTAARFWHDLWHAAAVLRDEPFTAHGRLERCREALVALYRLALAPGAPTVPWNSAWEGAEALPGAARVLDNLKDWLVSPLEYRAQWRCATRLAQTYESLMLPLAERLRFDYPWAMRNLAFQRLDALRPDQGPALAPDKVPRRPDPTGETEATSPPPGAGRYRIKARRTRE